MNSSDAFETIDELTVSSRFCGPPGSGNGGYVCGRLARLMDGDAVARLMLPPPLERPMAIRRRTSVAGGSEPGLALTLMDGDTVVATARPTELELQVPEAPDFEKAGEAARGFRGFREHVFPGCFVCGPERAEDDGLRIFPGSLSGAPVDAAPGVVAAPWVPSTSLAPAGQAVPSEFLWAALDCPGAFSFPQPEGKACVLGQMTVHLEGSVAVGERCVVIGWEIEHSGRKHRTGTALFGEDGSCRGVGVGTWIETPRD